MLFGLAPELLRIEAGGFGGGPVEGADAFSIEFASTDSIDEDAVLAELAGEGFVQAEDACAEDIGKEEGIERLPEGGRGIIDDAPAAVSEHDRMDDTDNADEREQSQFEGLLPVLVGKVVKATGRRSAGIIEDTIERTMGLAGPVDGALQVIGAGEVTGYGQRALPRGALYIVGGELELIFVAGKEGDTGTLAGIFPGDGLPEASACGHDEDGFFLKLQIHGE